MDKFVLTLSLSLSILIVHIYIYNLEYKSLKSGMDIIVYMYGENSKKTSVRIRIDQYRWARQKEINISGVLRRALDDLMNQTGFSNAELKENLGKLTKRLQSMSEFMNKKGILEEYIELK